MYFFITYRISKSSICFKLIINNSLYKELIHFQKISLNFLSINISLERRLSNDFLTNDLSYFSITSCVNIYDLVI